LGEGGLAVWNFFNAGMPELPVCKFGTGKKTKNTNDVGTSLILE
jgi:hypothetical protein